MHWINRSVQIIWIPDINNILIQTHIFSLVNLKLSDSVELSLQKRHRTTIEAADKLFYNINRSFLWPKISIGFQIFDNADHLHIDKRFLKITISLSNKISDVLSDVRQRTKLHRKQNLKLEFKFFPRWNQKRLAKLKSINLTRTYI